MAENSQQTPNWNLVPTPNLGNWASACKDSCKDTDAQITNETEMKEAENTDAEISESEGEPVSDREAADPDATTAKELTRETTPGTADSRKSNRTRERKDYLAMAAGSSQTTSPREALFTTKREEKAKQNMQALKNRMITKTKEISDLKEGRKMDQQNAQKIIEELRQEIATNKSTIDQQQTELAEQKEDLKNKKVDILRLEALSSIPKGNPTQESKDLKTENAKLKEEITQTKRQMDTDKTSHKERTQVDKGRATEKERIIKELSNALQNSKQEIAALTIDRDDYMTRLTELITGAKPTTTPEEPTNKILFLGDSNTENLRTECEKISGIEWTFKTLYTTQDISKFTSSANGKTLINQQDAIILLTGTNHIKINQPLNEIYTNLKATTENIARNKPIIIMEIPPFKTDQRKNNSTKLLNKTLQSLRDDHPNINTCNYREELDQLPTEEIMYDEIHINRQRPATIIANHIEKAISKLQITKGNANTTTKLYAIPEGKVGLIIGTKGCNLRKWTTELKVLIEVTKDPKPSAKVTGEEAKVDLTIEAMKALVDRSRPRETTTQTKDRYSSWSPAPQPRRRWEEPRPRWEDEARQQKEETRSSNQRGRGRGTPRVSWEAEETFTHEVTVHEEEEPRSRHQWYNRH